MRFGWLTSGITVIAVTAGALTVPEFVPGLGAAALASPGSGDAPEVDGRPLPNLPAPLDAADAIDGLPAELDDLPSDEVSIVPVAPVWTEVPNMPVEVRVPDAAPSPPSEESPSPEAPTDDPTQTPSEGPTGPAEEEQTDPAPTPESDGTSEELLVTLTQPDDLTQGVMLLEILTGDAPAVEGPADEVPTGPSAEPEGSTEEPTDEPSEPRDTSPAEPAVFVRPQAEDDPTDPPTGDPSDQPTEEPTEEPTDPAPTDPAPTDPDDPGDPDFTDPPNPAEPVDEVKIRVAYGEFDEAFGADWANRLTVVAYPACFVDTPEDEACSAGVPVEAVNNETTQELRFTAITLEELQAQLDDADTTSEDTTGDATEDPSTIDPSASLGRPGDVKASPAVAASPSAQALVDPSTVVYSVTSAPGGYGPTPISAAGEWQVGVGSGEFNYSYPFTMPPALGGAAPDLSLGYSSASVDGMTYASNGQAGPAGLGWELEPGFISRSYAGCKDDGLSTKGDLCWKTSGGNYVEEFSISLNGRVSRLTQVANTTNEFRAVNDQGWQIQRYSSTSPATGEPANDDNNNEGFKVTTPDGTQYWFGYGRDGTDSVWTVPVYGNDSGEPCYGSSGTANADRYCQQGWRWNLDKVIDPSGNTIKYFYYTEQNSYARWANTATGYRTAYDRGGLLDHIEYGMDRSNGTARQKVELTRLWRCKDQLTQPSANCTGTNSPTEAPNQWPDVPTDLICEQTGSCTVGSPSFFTTKRYDKVITKTVGGGSTDVVDEYQLEYTMPDPDGSGPDQPDLWLNRIVRTGQVGPGALSTPAVEFDGGANAQGALQNRVAPGGGRPYKKFRVTSVRNETGGRIDVEYGHATDGTTSRACDATYVGGRNRWDSTKECFATRWSPPAGGDPQWEWFHKYVVKRVALGDDGLAIRLGVNQASPSYLGRLRVYDYEYKGAPAWRYVGSPQTQTADEPWSDWRGYETTEIVTRPVSAGNNIQSGVIARERITRFRGMSRAPANITDVNNNTDGPTVRLDTREYGDPGDEPLDEQWLSGQTAESVTEAPGDNSTIERVYNTYDAITTVQQGRWARYVYRKLERTTTTITDPEATDNKRVHEIAYDVDPGGANNKDVTLGAVLQVHDRGKPSITVDDTCTRTTWAKNTSLGIRAPTAVRSYDAHCPSDPNNAANGQLYSQVQTTYDGGTLTKGLPTQVSTSTGTGPIVTTAEYDQYGRVKKTTEPGGDGNDLVTDIHYNSNGGDANELLTQIETVQRNVLHADHTPIGGEGPRDAVTITTLHPGHGLPTVVTDANGNDTRISYNQLGQPTEVYYPTQTGTAPPSIKYTYSLSAGEPSRVKTSTLREMNNGTPVWDDSYTFHDGWGRVIETQIPQPNYPDKRIVDATGYDERGLVRYQMTAVPNANLGGFATVLNADINAVQQYTETDYDPAGRPIKVKQSSLGSTIAATQTVYYGNGTLVQPPSGGATLSQIDRWGRTTAVELYNIPAPVSGGDILGRPSPTQVQDSAQYTYTPAGYLATATKALSAGTSTWSYGYDMAGRQLWSSDPDTGTSTTTYDTAGNPTEVTTGDLKTTINTSTPYIPQITKTNGLGQITTTSTTYDRINRPLRLSDITDGKPGTTLTTWGYDKAGYPPGVLPPNSAGQLTSISHPITGIEPGAGAAGEFTTVIGPFNELGLPKSSSFIYPAWLLGGSSGDPDVSYTTTATYNKAGQPTETTYPALTDPTNATTLLPSLTLTNKYTTGGRLESITNNNGLRVGHFEYNNRGQTTAITSGTYSSGSFVNGLRRGYTWEQDTGRLDTITGTVTPAALNNANASTDPYTAMSFDYNYDKSGNPLRIETTATDNSVKPATSDTGAWCYTYDNLNRLVRARTGVRNAGNGCTASTTSSNRATGSPYDLSYAFERDRLATVTDNLTSTAVTYGVNPTTDVGPNVLRPHQTTALTTTATATTNWPAELPVPGAMQYDDFGRITTWTPPVITDDPDVGPGSATTTYTYDRQGNLTQIAPVGAGAGTTSRFAYGPDGTRLARRTTKGAITTTTLYLPDGTELEHRHESQPAGSGASTRTATRTFNTPAGTPLGMQTAATSTSEKWTWFLADQQRSIRLTLNHTTSAITRQHYYPYGDPVGTQPASTTGRGYLNRPHEPGGHLRLDHRNYTPNHNQLTTPDPLLNPSDPQSFNPYTYSRSNPVTLGDPSGLGPFGPLGIPACGLHCQTSIDPDGDGDVDPPSNDPNGTALDQLLYPPVSDAPDPLRVLITILLAPRPNGLSFESAYGDSEYSEWGEPGVYDGVPGVPVTADESPRVGGYPVISFISWRAYIDGGRQALGGDLLGGFYTALGGVPGHATGKAFQKGNERWGSYGKHSSRSGLATFGKNFLKLGAFVFSPSVAIPVTVGDYLVNPGPRRVIITSEVPYFDPDTGEMHYNNGPTIIPIGPMV